MCRPHNQPVARSQALVNLGGAALQVHQHREKLRMCGLRDKTIGNHEIAEGVEDPINFPMQRHPALARDLPQISGYRPAFLLQHEEKDQRRHHRHGRMKNARQSRHDDKYRPQGRGIVKSMLVPARHLLPAVILCWENLCLDNKGSPTGDGRCQVFASATLDSLILDSMIFDSMIAAKTLILSRCFWSKLACTSLIPKCLSISSTS